MKYNPMNPTECSRLDEAHAESEEFIQGLVSEYGKDDAEEGLVGAIVMSECLNAASIRNRIDNHLALDEAFEEIGLESGQDHSDKTDSWEELQRQERPDTFIDNLGGTFDD